MKKILNTIHEDYHIHSINYSDGLNTIDEIVQYVPKVGLKKIAITDHSGIILDQSEITLKNRRSNLKRRKNVHNDIEVIFGIEGDLLDEEGNCCFDIQGHESEFSILSCHAAIFKGDLKNITQAYINAVEKYHDKIAFLGHVCLDKTSKYLDVELLAKTLNKYKVPIELNCAYLSLGKTDIEKLDKLLSLLETGVYVNSDMHTLADFDNRQAGFEYLKSKGYS